MDQVYSSDLLRAIQTAIPFAKRMGYGIIPCELLRERAFGSFEGISWADFKQEEPHILEQAGVETPVQLYARCEQILKRFSMDDRLKNSLFFTHAGLINMMVKVVLGMAPEEPPIGFILNASLTIIQINQSGNVLKCYNEVYF